MIQEERKKKALRRLKIILGQVGGVEKLVQEERYCIEILTQIAAIQEALRGVSREIVRNHLDTCVTEGVKNGREQAYYEELTNIMFKLSR